MNVVIGTAGTASTGTMLISTIAYMAFFFGIMWFLIIRPQRKRDQQVAEMQKGIKLGDDVLLNSGMYGKVVDIINDLFIIELGLNKSVRIPIKQAAVVAVGAPNLTIGKPVVEEILEEDEDDDEYEEYEDDGYEDGADE